MVLWVLSARLPMVTVMDLSTLPVRCPVAIPEGLGVVRESFRVGTACMALMDTECAAQVWRDLLFDGQGHKHGPGGLMMNRASVGRHLPYDGEFDVVFLTDVEGCVVGAVINVDPYADALEPYRDIHDSEGHGHGHGHGDVEGWTPAVAVPWVSAQAVLGDPAGLPEADATGGLLDVRFPMAGGVVTSTVHVANRVAQRWLWVWSHPVAG